jgi:cytochrome c biogenesis protein CcdA
MFRLIGLTVSIGLADSLNPSTVGPALYLASGEQPRTRILQFTAGVSGVFLLGGIVLVLGPGQALLALVPHPGATTRYIVETVVGVVIFAIGVVLWRRRNQLGHRDQDSEGSRHHGRSPMVLGATIGIVELPTAFLYFGVIAAIVASGVDIGRELFLLVLYNICFVLPLLAIVAILTVAGERAHMVLESVRSYLSEHWPVIVALLAMAAGLFVTALGVTGLTSAVGGPVGHISRRVRRVISR